MIPFKNHNAAILLHIYWICHVLSTIETVIWYLWYNDNINFKMYEGLPSWSAMHDECVTCAKECAVAMGANVLKPVLEWFSNRTATSFEDGRARRVVWTQLPVLFLTSQGWTRVAFATALSVFSRREENGKFLQAFIKFSKKKGKNCFPQCLKWDFESLFVVFWKYWPSLLRVSLTNAKVLFLHQANVLRSLTKSDCFIGWNVFSYKLFAERYGE